MSKDLRWTSKTPLYDAQMHYNRIRNLMGNGSPKCNFRTSPRARGVYKWMKAFLAEFPDTEKKVAIRFSRMIEPKGCFEGTIRLDKRENPCKEALFKEIGIVDMTIYGDHHDYVFLSHDRKDGVMEIIDYPRTKSSVKKAAAKAREWLEEFFETHPKSDEVQ